MLENFTTSDSIILLKFNKKVSNISPLFLVDIIKIKILRSDQKFCNRYWQFYKPINIQKIVGWINSGMSYL